MSQGADSNCDLSPIGNLIGIEQAFSLEKAFFCYLIVRNTINFIESRDYVQFDAQTTSNCCHGMSLLARDLISSVTKNCNLVTIRQAIEQKLDSVFMPEDLHWQIPDKLIQLSQLHILTYIREVDPYTGVYSSWKKLKNINQKLSNTFCRSLVRKLQKEYSNLVAFSYEGYASKLNKEMKITHLSVHFWSKYVQKQYIRTDSRGVSYAPCLYSMQISLAYLIAAKAKIAVINDIYDEGETLITRQLKVLEGDGKGNFKSFNFDLCMNLEESVIVFGGSSVISDVSPKNVIGINKWMNKFTHLVLACDIYYPQFPKVQNDPMFCRDPIQPIEEDLCELIKEHAAIHGVSAKNPSLFCLNHIYPASLKQVAEMLFSEKDNLLPISKIPKIFQ